ncbi:uncharacterized protein LOC127704495 [Mytilus californianus]|uniref:uncharacterized protein LOC127704495 n=1 Tax=Mytilus californianus TaxID=6549 RepID=UPI0022464E98|nr:uncharacterized protein LOC127704495 [Mytilus californianus]
MVKLAENVVFLDATYKGLTAYGYSFYALVARDEQQGRGTPPSYCISSDDTGEVVKIFLRSLKTTAENHGFDFRPRSFMVDRDTKEISAINEVFPNSSVLLCWFHVLQAVYRFLNKKESGVSGPMHAHTRKKVIDYIRTMKICTKVIKRDS